MNKNILFSLIAAFSAMFVLAHGNQLTPSCLPKRAPAIHKKQFALRISPISLSDIIRITMHNKIDSIPVLKNARKHIYIIQSSIQKYREKCIDLINQTFKCENNAQEVEKQNNDDIDSMLFILRNSL